MTGKLKHVIVLARSHFNTCTTKVPEARMPGHNGEAGKSPALSRNCNLRRMKRARIPAFVERRDCLRGKGVSDEDDVLVPPSWRMTREDFCCSISLSF